MRRLTKHVLGFGLATVALTLLFAGAGCEDGPDTVDVSSLFADNPYESAQRDTGLPPAPAEEGGETNVVDDGEEEAETNEVETVTPLSVSASPSTLNDNGDRSVITASGGVPGYSWSVSDSSRGILETDTGSSVIYQRLEAGDNGIRVEDRADSVANVVIQQP